MAKKIQYGKDTRDLSLVYKTNFNQTIKMTSKRKTLINSIFKNYIQGLKYALFKVSMTFKNFKKH